MWIWRYKKILPYFEMDINYNTLLYTSLIVILLHINIESTNLRKIAHDIIHRINKSILVKVFFIWIFILNLSSIVPYGFAFTAIFCYGISLRVYSYRINLYYKGVITLQSNIIAKLITILIQILTLGLRLSINITTGHLIFAIYSFSNVILIVLLFYELFVAFIQSYVFYLLSNLYYNWI